MSGESVEIEAGAIRLHLETLPNQVDAKIEPGYTLTTWEPLVWCEDNFGPHAFTYNDGKWCFHTAARWVCFGHSFFFRNVADAAFFKLMWC